jgi:hypothetical protein
MSRSAPTKYKTTNWSAYNDSLKRRGSLSIWFDPEMVWVPPPSGTRGRLSDAAIQACLTLKVLFGMPLGQTTGFVQSLLRLIGLECSVPDFSTLCRRQKTLNVSLPYRGGTGRLNLLIESTGIKAEGESEWTARKHGGPKRRIWRKIHIGIEEKTLAALLGSNAAGLSSTTISRLKADWWDDYDRWQRRDLSTRRFVYIWADSV